MQILAEIGNGTCKESCKTIWIRNIKYAIKTKTNPLGLNKTQRKNIKIENLPHTQQMKTVIKRWLVMMGTIIYLNQTKIIFVLGKKYNRYLK